jgi:hypothetical protein
VLSVSGRHGNGEALLLELLADELQALVLSKRDGAGVAFPLHFTRRVLDIDLHQSPDSAIHGYECPTVFSEVVHEDVVAFLGVGPEKCCTCSFGGQEHSRPFLRVRSILQVAELYGSYLIP